MKNTLIKLAKSRKIEYIILAMHVLLLILILAIKQDIVFLIGFIAVYLIDAIFTAIRKRPDYVLEQNKLWCILISNEIVIAKILFICIGLPIILLCTSINNVVFLSISFIISMTIILFASFHISKYLDKKLIRYE